MTTQEFESSARWKAKRASILRRDKYMCQECRRYGKAVEATVVHHIKPFEDYPELALVDSNLVSLCSACHNKKHPERAKNRGRRY